MNNAWRIKTRRGSPRETLANLLITGQLRCFSDQPGSKISRSCRAARRSRETFDVIAEGAQFADHLARTHLLRLFADGRPAFLVAHALMKNLPNQTTEPVSDRADRLGVAEAWDEPAIHDREDGALAFTAALAA
jgi:hypothetical protein